MTTKNADAMGPKTQGKCFFGGNLKFASSVSTTSTTFEEQKPFLSNKPLFRPKQGRIKK